MAELEPEAKGAGSDFVSRRILRSPPALAAEVLEHLAIVVSVTPKYILETALRARDVDRYRVFGRAFVADLWRVNIVSHPRVVEDVALLLSFREPKPSS